jgi:biopolymer transport protein ExbB/TolQ
MQETGSLVQTLIDLPIFESAWVLYLLIALSLASIAVMIERGVFYRSRSVDVDAVKAELSRHLDRGDFEAAAAVLKRHDALETNAVLAGLRAHDKGADSVEDLISGALGREKARYERRLSFLATLASNAPYVGLFGTVLGIIKAFRDLAENIAEASQAVMAGIAEALVATAVGLLVAIPAVLAFNALQARVNGMLQDAETLGHVLLSHLRGEEAAHSLAVAARSGRKRSSSASIGDAE